MKKLFFVLFFITGLQYSQVHQSLLIDKAPSFFYNQQILVDDNSYYVIGDASSYDNLHTNLTIAKFDFNGNKVLNFGENGIKKIQVVKSYTHFRSYIKNDTISSIMYDGQYNYPQPLMIKLDSNGDVLPDFGNDGKKPIFGLYDLQTLFSVASTSDGYLFLIESDSADVRKLDLVKINTLGEIDSSFATGGFFELDNQYSTIGYFEVHSTSERTFVIGKKLSVNNTMLVTAITNEGEADSSFGENGLLTSKWNNENYFGIYSARLSNDNLYLAVRRIAPEGWYEFAVTKLDYKGNKVPSFGADGVMSFNQPFMLENFQFIEYPENSFFLGYNNLTERPFSLEILNFDNNGIKNSNFGDNGYFILQDERRDNYLNSLVIVNDTVHFSMNQEVINSVISITATGEINTSFANEGISQFILPEGYATLAGISIYEENLFVGSTAQYIFYGIPCFTKINGNFSIDVDYSSKHQFKDYDEVDWVSNDFLIDENSDLYIVGSKRRDGNTGYVPVFNKLDQMGNRDTTVEVHSNLEGNTTYNQIATFDSLYFIVSGLHSIPPEITYPQLTKLSKQGIVDSSFGINGNAPVFSSHYDNSKKMHPVVDSFKNIYLLRFRKSSQRYEMLKLGSNGFIDSSFALNGILNLPDSFNRIFSVSFENGIFDIIGKSSEENILITRIDQMGSFLSAFGHDGTKELEITLPTLEDGIKSESGYFYVGDYNESPLNGVIIKLDSNGEIDQSFGEGGYYNLDINETVFNEKKIKLLYDDNYLYVARETGNPYGKIEVLKLNIDELTSLNESKTSEVLSYSLSQNYPNPFNPETKISYSLKEAGTVMLTVYDVLGNEVAKLVDEHKPAGQHEFTFKADDLPSGVYIYRIKAGDYTESKKMILLK